MIARQRTVKYQLRQRATLVLLLHQQPLLPNIEAAEQVQLHLRSVQRWRRRWAKGDFSLEDEPGRGRKADFCPVDHALVKAVACELVAETKQPLSRQSLADVTARAQAALGKPISRSTVWRILDTDVIKPWRYKYWIFPRDPQFAEKAGPILDLYAGTWQGHPLGPKDHILSADEKTSIQARIRCHPALPPAQGQPARIENEYERGGALQYLAAWDVRRGYVMGRCEPKTGIEPFGRLVNQVLSEEPYRSGERLFWIVDNGSSHRGETAKKRLRQVDSRIIGVHTPVHASWLNQVEIYFSIIQRKVLTPNDFAKVHAKGVKLAPDVDLKVIAARTVGFVGADLANVMNEATLLAARRGKAHVTMAELEEAIDRIVAGLEKKARVISQKEREIVAYHESGHALVAASVPTADPVHKISIIPRGIAALGYTLQLPTQDRYLLTKDELLDRIAVMLGGRVAEELTFQQVSTGAQDDLKRATDIARRMVTEYGMSERLGLLTFEPERQSLFLGGPVLPSGRAYSEETAREIDQEVKRIIEEAHARVRDLSTRRNERLDRLAKQLLEREVLEGEALQHLLTTEPVEV